MKSSCLAFLTEFYDMLLGRVGCRQQAEGACCPSDLAPNLLQQRDFVETEAEVQRAWHFFFLSQQPLPPSLPSALDLTPTIEGKSPNAFGSFHLPLCNPSASSLGKGYLEIALVRCSEWAMCKPKPKPKQSFEILRRFRTAH